MSQGIRLHSSLCLGLCPRSSEVLACMGRYSLESASRDSNHVMLEPLVIDSTLDTRHTARLDTPINTPAFESSLLLISMTSKSGRIKTALSIRGSPPAYDQVAAALEVLRFDSKCLHPTPMTRSSRRSNRIL